MRAKQRIVTGISFLISKTEPSYTCLACSRHCETDFSSGALLTGHQQAREIELKTKSGTYPLCKLGRLLASRGPVVGEECNGGADLGIFKGPDPSARSRVMLAVCKSIEVCTDSLDKQNIGEPTDQG